MSMLPLDARALQVHDRVSFNSLCFQGADQAEILDNWRALSPSLVSIMSYQLLDEAFAPLRDTVASRGYQVETITHAFILAKPVVDRDSWGAARDTLGRVIDAAKAIGARSVYMLTGGHGTATWEACAEAFSEAVAPCIDQARQAGVRLLTEPAPLLYSDLHIAHSLRDTVLLAEMADIGVCIDLFPIWGEAGLKETIARAMPRCHLVQVGDYVPSDRSVPCRAAAGEGVIPIDRLINWILDAGYTGAFDLELLGPRIDAMGQVQACRQSADAIEAILMARDI